MLHVVFCTIYNNKNVTKTGNMPTFKTKVDMNLTYQRQMLQWAHLLRSLWMLDARQIDAMTTTIMAALLIGEEKKKKKTWDSKTPAAPSMREWWSWCRISVKHKHVWLLFSQASYFSLGLPLLCFSSTLPFLSLTTNTSVTATFNFHYTHVQRLTQPTQRGNHEFSCGCTQV